MSSAYSFCIEPLAGSALFVISLPTGKTLVSFTPVLELNIPEYIIELNNLEAFGLSSTRNALGEKSTEVLLKPPRILDSSIAKGVP